MALKWLIFAETCSQLKLYPLFAWRDWEKPWYTSV